MIISKIKDKPVATPSNKFPKTFKLLPQITEEQENKDEFKRSSTLPMDDPNKGFMKMSTQSFKSGKWGLELDVQEANKHFDSSNRHHRFQMSNEFLFDTQEEDKDRAADSSNDKFMNSKEFLMDSSALKDTKEVPAGPKSKSVPRNDDFFRVDQDKPHKKQEKIKAKELSHPSADEETDDLHEIMIESGESNLKKGIKGVIKKRFAFLENDDSKEELKDESEQVNDKEEEKKSKLVFNPAATGAPELQSDSSSERSEVLNFKRKGGFKKPMINTDAINEMFTYGGEKGDLLIRVDDEEENLDFMKELEELASQ